jgi:hypothetical protein
MTKTISEIMPLDDLFEIPDAFYQDLDNALMEKYNEMIADNDINEEDIVDFQQGITVEINITYKTK